MAHKLKLSLLTMALILTGCANKPLPPTEKVVQTLTISAENQSQIDLQEIQSLDTEYSRATDMQLHYVTQGDTSKLVALKSLAFVGMMLSGGGHMDGFSKEELKGTEVAGVLNPSFSYLTPRIAEILKAEMDKQPTKKQYRSAVTIRPLNWQLIYKNLAGGDDNYQLVMKTNISSVGGGGGGSFITQTIDCGADVKVAEYTLPQWQANNYAKVQQETHKMLDSCVDKFKGAARLYLF